MSTPRQGAVTAASGSHAERLDNTFVSFRRNSFLELHAFIIGDRLPTNRVPGITYHLVAFEGGYQDELRELYYRRFVLIDQLGCDYVLLVDNSDVLCLQEIPELPVVLRGAALAACVEHNGSQVIQGQGTRAHTSTRE